MPRLQTTALLLLVLLALPFIWHSAELGTRGLTTTLPDHRLFTAPLPNALIFAHMIAGAALTLLAPLQLIAWTRARHPAVHRRMGYVTLAAAGITGIGGLGYIALNGTVGGPPMSAGFALYGALVLLAGSQAVRHARARNLAAHRDWALRLAVLAMGSFLYRVHYGLWYWATDGLWSETDGFTGAFDLFNVAGFYLPYLIILELILRRRRHGSAARRLHHAR